MTTHNLNKYPSCSFETTQYKRHRRRY